MAFDRKIVKCSSLLSKMMFLLRITVKPWTMMELGLGIWNYKQLLLSLAVIYVFTGTCHRVGIYATLKIREPA